MIIGISVFWAVIRWHCENIILWIYLILWHLKYSKVLIWNSVGYVYKFIFIQTQKLQGVLKSPTPTSLYALSSLEGLINYDLTSNTKTWVLPSPLYSFDHDTYEIVTLFPTLTTPSGQIKETLIRYYDIRYHPVSLKTTSYLKFYDRQPYTYLKSDIHRMALMSPTSLLFKNHGDTNILSKAILMIDYSGKRSL